MSCSKTDIQKLGVQVFRLLFYSQQQEITGTPKWIKSSLIRCFRNEATHFVDLLVKALVLCCRS